MAKDKFLRGALILTVAGLMVKVIGSVNRILLSRMLGGEGIGLYQMAYPVYLLMLSVSSAGVPIAVSILVAEKVARNDFAGAGRIFKVTLALMAVFGLLFGGGLFGVSNLLLSTGIIRDTRASLALYVLTPAVFFSSILASFRGYFQGYQMMTPPAVSQVLEQLVRVMTMVLLAYFLLPYGLEYAAAGAAFGAVPGALTGLVVLGWFYHRASLTWQEKIAAQANYQADPVGLIAKRLVLLALPVSCANIMVPITSSIDMLLVPNCLALAGFGVAEATTLFGYLSGMAQPLIMMATIPTMSIAASLVPAVSEAFTLQRFEEIRAKSLTALKICLLLTLPAAVGMWALAEPISLVLYGTGKAAPVIGCIAPSIVFLGIFQVTTGALQGIGKTTVPMWNMAAGALVKAGALYVLTSRPDLNILGAAWASNINFALVACLNVYFLWREGLVLEGGSLVRVGLASLALGFTARLTYAAVVPGAGQVISLAVSMLAAGVVYVAAVGVLGVLTPEEKGKLPFIGKYLRK
jgi:stage V sporulation protein B